MRACPHARDQCGGELAAGHKTDNECTEPEPVMHVKRKHRHGEADDEERNENDPHDREQHCDPAFVSS
jgi:hypothetical protein